jgi:hypothetical protein
VGTREAGVTGVLAAGEVGNNFGGNIFVVWTPWLRLRGFSLLYKAVKKPLICRVFVYTDVQSMFLVNFVGEAPGGRGGGVAPKRIWPPVVSRGPLVS